MYNNHCLFYHKANAFKHTISVHFLTITNTTWNVIELWFVCYELFFSSREESSRRWASSSLKALPSSGSSPFSFWPRPRGVAMSCWASRKSRGEMSSSRGRAFLFLFLMICCLLCSSIANSCSWGHKPKDPLQCSSMLQSKHSTWSKYLYLLATF